MTHRFKLSLVCAVLLAGCSAGGHNSDGNTRVPVTVAGVTYQWPYDTVAGAGDPKGWSKLHVAYFPKGYWNETVGSVPSMRFPQNAGYYAINISPAKTTHWNIKSDGHGLPDGVRLSNPKSDGSAVLGLDDRPGNANPPTIAVLKGDPEAYITCLGPSGPNPVCILFLNDRGAVHTLTMPWGKWGDAAAAVKLYRRAIGAPDPTS